MTKTISFHNPPYFWPVPKKEIFTCPDMTASHLQASGSRRATACPFDFRIRKEPFTGPSWPRKRNVRWACHSNSSCTSVLALVSVLRALGTPMLNFHALASVTTLFAETFKKPDVFGVSPVSPNATSISFSPATAVKNGLANVPYHSSPKQSSILSSLFFRREPSRYPTMRAGFPTFSAI